MSRKWKRNRQTPATPSGQWCSRSREMMESAAYRIMSRASHQVLSRIELELRYHAGKENGRLPVTFDNFVAYGMQRKSIAPALRELEALGFIEITERGRGGNAEYYSPNYFRLTYEPTKNADPSNEWKRFAAGADAASDAKMMVEAASIAKRARKNKNLMYVNRLKKLSAKNKKPMSKMGIGANVQNGHRKANFPDVQKGHYRVSGKMGTTLDTLGGGRSSCAQPTVLSDRGEVKQ